jgi:homoserine O-acetyltransferase
MDLHDVSQGRGGVEEALRRVRSRVLAVGISSDQLYSAAEVREGAEALIRIGGDGSYQEIESPHGHDAFLLESEQLAAILGRFLGT